MRNPEFHTKVQAFGSDHIGGTSLEVGSAAQLAHMYHGKSLIIINKSKTKLEGKADVVVHDSIGAVLSGVTDLMGIGK